MSNALTLTRIFAAPPLAGSLPTQTRLSPDGRLVTFLRPASDDRERLDLWGVDIATGAERCLVNAAEHATQSLSEEEKARRERRRVFSRGIVEYEWSDDGTRILLPLDGVVYAFDVDTSRLTRLSPPGTTQTDLRLAPGGARIAYVRDGDLYVYDLALASEQRLTHDGSATVSNGLAEFIAQEEMHRFEGYWWSPAGTHIAFARVDSSAIPVSWRYDIGAGGTVAVAQRYPYAGAENAGVELCIVAPGALQSITTVPWAQHPDDYLARVNWLPDSTGLLVQRQQRDQRRLDLQLHRLDGSPARVILTEAAATWVELHDNLHWIDAGRFTWTSERTGQAQLYVGSLDGELTQVTTGPLSITSVHGVSADQQRVYVMGWRDDPTQMHLYEVALDTGVATRITQALGWHQCVVAKHAAAAVDTWSSPDQPPRIDLVDLDTRLLKPLVANEIVQGHPYHEFHADHPTATFGTLTAADGQTLFYRLTRPAGFDPVQRHPVLINVYGGPTVSRARQEWLSGWHLFLARAGYAIFELDNRGSALRGPAFTAPIHLRLGDVEVRDQLAGLDWLQQQPWVDPLRVAVAGHSYGGYLTLLLLAKAPGRFAAGIATAPVCDWTLYDTHYTERYLGTPAANPEGYALSDVSHWLTGLRDPLLLVHGMADDNVLFTHTTRILAALQAQGTQFDVMTYPGSKHGLAEPGVSVHRHTLMHNFLQRHLARGAR